MNLNEFKHQFQDGALDLDEDYWVCAYNFIDPTARPTRHLAPVKGRIYSEEHLDWDKSILTGYYFNQYLKSGMLSTTSLELHVIEIFRSEKECREGYKKLLDKASEAIAELRRQSEAKFKEAENKILVLNDDNNSKL